MIQLMKVGPGRDEWEIPIYPSWLELKESVLSICNLYNPFFSLCNTILDINVVGATGRAQRH